MADGTLQLVIDRVDEEGVNAHCLLLDADMSACLELWKGGGG